MYRRILAALLCTIMVSASLTSCGKSISTGDSGENSASQSANENSGSESTADAEIMNFTAPEKGDTIIEMNIRDYGTVKIRLFPEYADKGVENFIGLAKDGYYDGLSFHRVIKDFMIQGGDPLGTGQGGKSMWGSSFDGGTDPHLTHLAGALAYANSGSTASNGSQFYIVTGMQITEDTLNEFESAGYSFSESVKSNLLKAGYGYPFLDGSYTIFGQVIDGLDIIFDIQNVQTDSNDKPTKDVIMDSVKVTEYNGEEIKWFISDYDYQPPTEAPVENVPVANFTAPEKGETVVNLKIKDYGDVKIKLFPEYADKGVENFVELVKKGYYDGLTFHRVIKDFMIQGGDPNGNGTGGESTWGGKFEGGTDPHIIHVTGAVAYANSGATSTNGSQFYIVTGEVYDQSQLDELSSYGYKLSDSQKELYKKCGGTPFLDGNYTVFGQVYEGLDIIFKIQDVETDTTTDKPVDNVIIESATVGEYDGEQIRWYTEDYGIKRGGEDAAVEATTSAETASEESSSSEETTTEE